MNKGKMSDYKSDNFPLRVIVTKMVPFIPRHNHDFVELVFFAEGNATHTLSVNDKNIRYSVMQGDFFAIMPREMHSFEECHLACYYNIIFSSSLISHEMKELMMFDTWSKIFGGDANNERSKVHLGLQDRTELSNYIKRLTEELDMRKNGYKVASKAILLEILLLVLRYVPKKMQQTRVPVCSNPDILNILNEMEKTPEKHYVLHDLAKKAHMCVSGFTKKFRDITGGSPIEYLLNLRIDKAEQLLLTTNLSVYDIAEQCGFYDINYFIKVFRRHHGLTPAKFRRDKRRGN